MSYFLQSVLMEKFFLYFRLNKSHNELKTFVRDRAEKFIDAQRKQPDQDDFLMYTTEPVYVKFIKFSTDKNIRSRHWDSMLPERRNEVRVKFLHPLENAIRDGLYEWKICKSSI